MKIHLHKIGKVNYKKELNNSTIKKSDTGWSLDQTFSYLQWI